MKKHLKILSIFVLPFLSNSCKSIEPTPTPPIITRIVDRTPAGIINYFNSLISKKKVLVGQHTNGWDNIKEAYTEYVVGLKTLSGKYPALIGIEYGVNSNMDMDLNNQYAINFWNGGGFVAISWHADNPFTDGYSYRWDSVRKKDSIDLSKLLKMAPESKEKTNYRTGLLHMGNALKKLKDAGVTVIWRPFHEMNGDFYWWGTNNLKNPTNVDAYKLLWKDMFDTFKTDLGLDNLIWVYSPNCSKEWTSSVGAFYPGSEYVDVVGVDIYSIIPEFRDYTDMKVFNKPIVVGEIGPNSSSYGNYNELDIIQQLKGKAAYFLQWSSWSGGAFVSIKDNLNAIGMMKDPSSITLNELNVTALNEIQFNEFVISQSQNQKNKFNYKLLDSNDGKIIASLYNLQGKLVYNNVLNRSSGVIDFNNNSIQNSIYILKISTLNREYIRKIAL